MGMIDGGQLCLSQVVLPAHIWEHAIISLILDACPPFLAPSFTFISPRTPLPEITSDLTLVGKITFLEHFPPLLLSHRQSFWLT